MSRRQSAAVYRRRRLVFFTGILLVLALVGGGVWLAIAQPWVSDGPGPVPESTQTPTQTPTPDPTATDAPTPTATPGDQTPEPEESDGPVAVACEGPDILVEAVTDAESYGSGENPKLSIRLTNTSGQDCVMDVGTATQRLVVSSGPDVWWRSTDCQEESSSLVATIAAGETVESREPVVWDRTRSSTTTCDDENRPRAAAGGASYHVQVEIGGFSSMQTTQIFLH